MEFLEILYVHARQLKFFNSFFKRWKRGHKITKEWK